MKPQKESNKNKIFKKKIYLVPHSHWDREWYFTEDTSNVLLNSNFVEFENLGKKKWFLDGQWSLVDDLIKWKDGRKEIIRDAIKNNKISVGPLYSQPDVFNSQGETIIRNFEMGSKIAKKFGVAQLKTAYLPDTFGFGENMPQIFKHCKLDNFVFWRGLDKKTLDKNDFFMWEGIDGSKIKSFVLKNGYYSLGTYYPYNAGKIFPKKNDPKYFLDKVDRLIDEISGRHDSLILPLGGDQAPYMYYQDDFIEMINNKSTKYKFELISNYDQFMKNKITKTKYKGNLRTPISGKIHRTISSSRYDIKKEFRDAEDSLYYLLEPLEIYYQSKDKIYDFEKYKDENIIKPLLIAQTHDSLGGCNTDVTNQMQLTRIARVRQNIDSQVDLLIKKLLQSSNIKNETLSIFNPAPFKNTLNQIMTIYSNEVKELNVRSKDLNITSLSFKNISLNSKKPLYKNKIILSANNLNPLEITNFNLLNLKSNNSSKIKTKDLNIKNGKLELKIGNEKFYLSIDLIEDKGDSYDFSPGKVIKNKITWNSVKSIHLNNIETIICEGKINNSKFNLEIFIIKDEIGLKGNISNKFKNTRVSLNVEHASKKLNIKKSQNLALTNFVGDDYINDWKSSLKEYPANVDVNDGIIKLNNKLNIFTKGNNEIYRIKNGVKIVLYRTYGYVTGSDLDWRPTTSGLSWKEESPDSQLEKNLTFDFKFSINKTIKKYNQFKFKPYAYKVQERNFIANKKTKFVINNILKPNKQEMKLSIKNKNIFISSMRKLDDKILIRASNMIEKENELEISKNNKTKMIKFKKYEIKEIKI